MEKTLTSISTIDNEAPVSVGPNQTSIVKIKAGYTRLRDHFTFGGGLLLTHITNVSIWRNGQILRELGSASDIDARNQYNGLPAYSDNSIFTISHIREGLRRFVESHATAIGMATGIENATNSLEIKFELNGSAPANSTISSIGEVSQPTGTGIVLAETVETFTWTTDGEKPLISLIQENEQIDMFVLEEDGLTVDSLEVRNFGQVIFKRTKAENDHIIKSAMFKTPQAGLFTYDKSERGFGKEPLIATPNSRFELRPVVSGISGSGTLKVRKIKFQSYESK